jgi:serine/threonine protein phosphatase PrpC
MKEQTTTLEIQAATVSDRGLSEKRPLNEDSFLSDPARHIFAVADGVGGANAGEVASQTAMEVLDDAFRNHEEGADIEDLMELAIQRANASIHQMAREHPKLAAMATTVVALHLDGQIATIGHVGDSRLYRLTPDGKLHRDTADHSVVEEEVRAGRMTPEQAAHHPSRNVISRALGAEQSVEVDMKILEVQEGTSFLLCSDGITRHISDNEIREILSRYRDLEEACTEMKRRCYERGAEDNLTAVVVRVGNPPENLPEDVDTIEASRADLHDTLPGVAQDSGAHVAHQQAAARLTPPSRVAFPAISSSDGIVALSGRAAAQSSEAVPPPAPPQARRSGGFGRALLMILLLGVVGAAAFFVGKWYQTQQETPLAVNTNTSPTPTPTPARAETSFEKRRSEIDNDVKGGLAKLEAERNGRPLESLSPEFLYLYGHALHLSKGPAEASNVYKLALDKLKERQTRNTLKIEKMAAIVEAIQANNPTTLQAASKQFEEILDAANRSVAETPSNSNASTGESNPGAAVPTQTPQ